MGLDPRKIRQRIKLVKETKKELSVLTKETSFNLQISETLISSNEVCRNVEHELHTKEVRLKKKLIMAFLATLKSFVTSAINMFVQWLFKGTL